MKPILRLRATARRSVLAERDYRLFVLGYSASLAGSAMVPVALTFAVLNEGHGTADVGYVLAAETVPLVALLLVGGVIADRFGRRATMLAADAGRLVSEGLLAVLLLTGSPPLWVFMVLAGVLGAGQALFNPALTGLIPEIVQTERLQQANGLLGVAASTAQVVGPSLAGVIVAAGGAGWAIAVDAASYAVSGLCLLALRSAARAPAPAEPASLLNQLAAGWQEFRSRTWLWLIVAQYALFNALAFAPFMVLGAIVARDHLGGAVAWGAILATFGAGSIAGALAALRFRPRRPLVAATLGTAVFALPLGRSRCPVAPWRSRPQRVPPGLACPSSRRSGTPPCSGRSPRPSCPGSARTTGSAPSRSSRSAISWPRRWPALWVIAGPCSSARPS